MGGEVFLGIIVVGVSPGSKNPDSISDQKNVIFHTGFQIWPELFKRWIVLFNG